MGVRQHTAHYSHLHGLMAHVNEITPCPGFPFSWTSNAEAPCISDGTQPASNHLYAASHTGTMPSQRVTCKYRSHPLRSREGR
ncbi:hypothetical protein GDO78_012271 [Eleutherodactylus coqui]|uniref:Uncharacterized protein n=1 Tax=Eleutherodactylus coqui TaxID=57060 RepID=A0A8J6F5A0_ELECQ|nr:hypothetical protein GDO78_012271 [Eleutherodactylus coqui]